jgi:hypothetical protein
MNTKASKKMGKRVHAKTPTIWADHSRSHLINGACNFIVDV